MLLILAMLAGLLVIPVGAAWSLPAYVIIEPGEFVEIRTEGLAREWRWSCSDDSVVDWDGDEWSCGLRGLKPGTATITVKYTMDNKLSPAYEVTETCSVIVKDPDAPDTDTPSKLEPLVSYGTVGEDVSGMIDGAKGFRHGFLPVRYKGLWGLANAEMKLVVPFQYEDGISEDQETKSNSTCSVNDMGYMAVQVDGRDYIIDWRGNVIYAASGAGKIVHAYLKEGYILVRRYFDLSHLDRYETEYYNFSGEEITKTQADSLQRKAAAELARIHEARGDLYMMNWGLYCRPTDDKVTLEIKSGDKVDVYRASEYAREGMLVLRLKGGLYGAVDVSNLSGTVDEDTLLEHTVIPFEYDYLHDSSDGYVSYQKGDKFGLLKNPVNPPSGEAVKPSTPTTSAKPATPTTPTAPAKPASSDFTIESGVLTKYNGKGGAVSIPEGVTRIKNNAFDTCTKLTSVTIPSSVTSIGTFAFYGCIGLTSVEIPSGVTEIETSAFAKCRGLTSVTIPSSVTELGETLFYDCANLKDIYYGGTYAQWQTIKIGDYNDAMKSATIHYSGDSSSKPNPPALPEVEQIPASGTAYAATQTIEIDGIPVTFRAYALKNSAGNSTNYVRLRDVAYALRNTGARFEVGWNGAVSIMRGDSYTAAGGEMGEVFSGDQRYQGGATNVTIDGQSAPLTAITLIDAHGGGHNYFKLRDLGQVLGFNVGWTSSRGVYIETDRPYSG